MDEYISREAVLSKCDDIWNNADETTQTGIDTINTIDEITDFIESLPIVDVQPVNQWISVKDRLPKEMQDKSINSRWNEAIRPSDSVLILTTGGSYDVAWYSYAYNDWTTNESYTYKNWEIAFWQPLPEAPLDR